MAVRKIEESEVEIAKRGRDRKEKGKAIDERGKRTDIRAQQLLRGPPEMMSLSSQNKICKLGSQT